MTRLLLALCLIAAPAWGGATCTGPAVPAQELVGALEGPRFGETRRGGGFVGGDPPQSILVVYANDATGTWTTIRLNPDGSGCIVSSGDGWMDLSPIGPEGTDT